MIIEYQRVDYPHEPRYFPLIDLEIIFPLRKRYLTKALVDSGSETSLFAKEILDDLGIDISNYPRKQSLGAAGWFETIHYPIDVVILGQKIRLDTNWASMGPQGFNLLGRHDFFRKFRVHFNERKRFMEILPYK